jgi:hypothetical protein
LAAGDVAARLQAGEEMVAGGGQREGQQGGKKKSHSHPTGFLKKVLEQFV